MIMKQQTQAPRFEPRWPVALAFLVMVSLFALLPERLMLLPGWFLYVVAVALLAPMAGVGLTAARRRWLRIEHTSMLLFVVFAGAVTLANLANLIGAMLHRSVEVSGLQLLESSIAVWLTNVLTFSLLYWQIDRGGPEARVNNAGGKPDWLFPQEGARNEDVPQGWRPAFVDYLFLGYSTATAFSTTDVMPLTARAKLLMMLESTISLATIVVVAARAINILGS